MVGHSRRGAKRVSNVLVILIVVLKSFLSYVSELLYIHSKVMIVDDRRVIVSCFLIFHGYGTDIVVIDGFSQHQRP